MSSPHENAPLDVPAGAPKNTLDDWIDSLAARLGVDADVVDRTLLLDVARDAAHNVARPAAPLTTFLVGYAAASHGGGAQAVADASAAASALAAEHQPSDD
ncbi:DUF6457 domain-containing protein [uncultured Jatrophihabitans sp.]|uniref:DUF6457 domain-containing protein n=1 Tax=uncultured Jatrophihabitans sp. TaxID=1610747 RepID=UPI0035C9E2F3